MGALGRGCTSRVASARASLMVWNALVAASVHVSGVLPLGVPLRRSCRGLKDQCTIRYKSVVKVH